jgi:hypothetical protein
MPPYPVSNQLNMQQSPLVLILLISSSLRDLGISSFSSKWGKPRRTHFPLDIVLPSRSCGSELDEKSIKSCSPILNFRKRTSLTNWASSLESDLKSELKTYSSVAASETSNVAAEAIVCSLCV